MTSAQMIRNHVDSAVRFSSPCSGCLLACLPPDFRAVVAFLAGVTAACAPCGWREVADGRGWAACAPGVAVLYASFPSAALAAGMTVVATSLGSVGRGVGL